MHERQIAMGRVGFAEGAVEWFQRLSKAAMRRGFESRAADPVVADQFLKVLRVVEECLPELHAYVALANEELEKAVALEIEKLDQIMGGDKKD